jgi:TonB family protein
LRERSGHRAWQRRSARLAALSVSLLWSAASLPLSAQAAPPPAGKTGDAASLAKAERLLGEGNFQAAAAAFAAANERAGGHCGACLLGLARAKLHLGDFDAGIAANQEAVAALAGDPLLGSAQQHLGDLFLQRAGECPPPPCGPAALADLTAAGEAYEQALASGGSDRAAALLGLARSRFRRSLHAQAAAAASEALAAAGTGPVEEPARVLLCRARAAADPAGARLSAGKDHPSEIYNLLKGAPIAKPVKISTPAPIYPEDARKLRITGRVILELIIDREGCVARPRVLQGLTAGLDHAALSAVANWVFAPATLFGEAVPIYYTLTINFALDPRSPQP